MSVKSVSTPPFIIQSVFLFNITVCLFASVFAEQSHYFRAACASLSGLIWIYIENRETDSSNNKYDGNNVYTVHSLRWGAKNGRPPFARGPAGILRNRKIPSTEPSTYSILTDEISKKFLWDFVQRNIHNKCNIDAYSESSLILTHSSFLWQSWSSENYKGVLKCVEYLFLSLTQNNEPTNQ